MSLETVLARIDEIPQTPSRVVAFRAVVLDYVHCRTTRAEAEASLKLLDMPERKAREILARTDRTLIRVGKFRHG